MSKKSKFIIFILTSLVISTAAVLLFAGNDIPLLNPKGEIASKEYQLMVFATLLSLIVVVPVFTMTFYIVYKYREGNKSKKKYRPEWDSNKVIEGIWWGVPIILITILSVVTWKSSHELDPFKPLEAKAKPLTIQAVALQWKWLFIYPEQDIATMNYVQFPINQPVRFQITADAPMNALWIPSLAGQMYAMNGMSTSLHLMADEIGDYRGLSTNISGKGFAGMRFTARASDQTEFDQWVEAARVAPRNLDMSEYNRLSEPSENEPPAYYVLKDKALYNKIIDQFGHEHD
ncbi:MAG TPA: ubiquinol oxidase subunit II [Candidatus Saccharimonadales bacterium]|nr:ubiquinol oxidase subunit II [Candidatus Saccharimonadales bacterium]